MPPVQRGKRFSIAVGSVVLTEPLLVRRDGDSVDVPAKPTSVVVVAEDRVIVANIDQKVYILAKIEPEPS